MATGQKLRGLVGQGMSGRRKRPAVLAFNFPAATHTWTCPATGLWRFVLWGGGAGGNNTSNWGGASGAFYLAERLLTKGQTVQLSVGKGGKDPGPGGPGANGEQTTVTLPSGEVLTAGGGVSVGSNTGGAATANRNLDIVLQGSAGVTTATSGANGAGTNPGAGGAPSGSIRPGSGAPGWGPYRGGDGGTNNGFGGRAPGGGGTTDSADGEPGGDGLVLIHLARVSV